MSTNAEFGEVEIDDPGFEAARQRYLEEEGELKPSWCSYSSPEPIECDVCDNDSKTGYKRTLYLKAENNQTTTADKIKEEFACSIKCKRQMQVKDAL